MPQRHSACPKAFSEKKKRLKIVHLTVVRELTLGQKKQLGFERDAARRLAAADWTTIAYHDGGTHGDFVRRIPWIFRGQFRRKFFAWIVALYLSRRFDIVMVRHVPFDPFVFFFAPMIRNRVSVHHAKEIDELRMVRTDWRGKAAAHLESKTGRFSAKHAKMILGVTQEIADYQCTTHDIQKPAEPFPNGVDTDAVSLLEDKRDPRQLNAVFICGTFSDWHGLDKLITAVDNYKPATNALPLTLHLIGKMTEKQILMLSETKRRRQVFKIYGLLDTDDYISILAKADIGITSLALERKGLAEASTLKVREMLAMGLPVYSGHRDIALPANKPFVHVTNAVELSDLVEFATSTKALQRNTTRDESVEKIEKLSTMKNAVALFADQHHIP